MTKSDINKKLNELEQYNYEVLNFSSRNIMYSGNRGWVDYVVMSNHNIWTIELKLGKDRMSEVQNKIKKKLESIENVGRNVFYRLMTENNVNQIIDEIIRHG